MVRVSFIETASGKYNLQTNTNTVGRQWDNLANAFSIQIPIEQRNRTCSMLFYFENRFVDMIIVNSETIDVRNNISQYPYIDISFRFTDASGYVKNTEVKRFYFESSCKPANFVPGSPVAVEKLESFIATEENRAIYKHTLTYVLSPLKQYIIYTRRFSDPVRLNLDELIDILENSLAPIISVTVDANQDRTEKTVGWRIKQFSSGATSQVYIDEQLIFGFPVSDEVERI